MLRERPVRMRSFNNRNLSEAGIERKISICTLSAVGWVSLGGADILLFTLPCRSCEQQGYIRVAFTETSFRPSAGGETTGPSIGTPSTVSETRLPSPALEISMW